MIDEDDRDEAGEPRSFSGVMLNRAVAILFVLAIYMLMFLKILVLQ